MPSFLPTTVRTHLAALRMLLVLTVITGIVYPLLVTGVAQTVFPSRANGSPVTLHGTTVGSSLIGQRFTLVEHGKDTGRPDPNWFQPRPSAGDYDPLASGASNLGPNSPDLVKTVKERRAAVAAFDGVNPKDVPPDAVTASGSGLDPGISSAYAYEQVPRVAAHRGLDRSTVDKLVAANTHDRSLGFLGQRYVNVVQLNLALARLG